MQPYLDDWQLIDEAVEHRVELENVEEHRLVLHVVQRVVRALRDRPQREVPVVNDARRYDRQVVIVTVSAVVAPVVVAQQTGLEADQLAAVVAAVLLLGQRLLGTNVEDHEAVQLLGRTGLDQLPFVEQLRTVAYLLGGEKLEERDVILDCSQLFSFDLHLSPSNSPPTGTPHASSSRSRRRRSAGRRSG